MSKMNKFQAFRERNRKSNGYLLRKVSFNVAYKIVRFVLLFGLCFLILQPLLNKISISFMEERDLYDSTINVIPRHFTDLTSHSLPPNQFFITYLCPSSPTVKSSPS